MKGLRLPCARHDVTFHRHLRKPSMGIEVTSISQCDRHVCGARKEKHMTFRMSLVIATATAGAWLATRASAEPLFFSTGNADGRLGALSQPPNQGKLETETADDFILTETTTISQVTLVGLIPAG